MSSSLFLTFSALCYASCLCRRGELEEVSGILFSPVLKGTRLHNRTQMTFRAAGDSSGCMLGARIVMCPSLPWAREVWSPQVRSCRLVLVKKQTGVNHWCLEPAVLPRLSRAVKTADGFSSLAAFHPLRDAVGLQLRSQCLAPPLLLCAR